MTDDREPIDLTPYLDLPDGTTASITPAKRTPPASRTLRVSGFAIAWALWVLFGAVFEIWALIRPQRNDTFSENWWSVFRVRQKVPVWLRIALLIPQLAFLCWLPFHLPFGLLSF